MTERLVFRGATLIDGTGAEPQHGRVVIVEEGRVAAVVSEAQGSRGTTIDLDGLTLLPGLVNAHVHLCLGAEADPVTALRGESLATTTIKMIVRARQTLEAGVTTVRDLGGREYAELAVRDAIRAGLVPGPRILAAGKGICMTGGHGWWLGREADGPVDMRRAVREQLKAGVDVIKLFATGGVMTAGADPNAPQLEADEIAAAIEEARKAGRRVAAHAQATDGIAWCVDAGITSIEHGVFLTEPVASRMVQRGVAMVPTLIAPHAIASGGLKGGIPEFMVRKSEAIRARHRDSFRLAMRMGVPIAAGTDAGTPLNPHGSMVPELELMVDAGMSALEAIRAATSTAAAVLGLADQIGCIAPGFAADLVAVGGSPTGSIQALDDVRLVVVGGRTLVDRITA